MRQDEMKRGLDGMSALHDAASRRRAAIAWSIDSIGLSRRLLAGLLAVSLALVASITAAQQNDDSDAISPCLAEDPPDWCIDIEPTNDFEPRNDIAPEGTGPPALEVAEVASPAEGQSLVLVGTTVVAPPVVWINGRPSDPGRVYGTGEAADFVNALELLLPAGWTIWAPENFAKFNPAVGGGILWDGNGQVWPDVIEALAQQYGMEVTADIANHQAVINSLSANKPKAPIFLGAGEATSVGDARTDASSAPQEPEHPLYRQYVTSAQLSPEPLPDTVGRVAWRFVPVGVQIDLSALGAYVNAPVFQWDINSVSVTPKAALEALMPTGYCIDDGDFPTVKAAVCGDDIQEADADGIGRDENDDPAS